MRTLPTGIKMDWRCGGRLKGNWAVEIFGRMFQDSARWRHLLRRSRPTETFVILWSDILADESDQDKSQWRKAPWSTSLTYASGDCFLTHFCSPFRMTNKSFKLLLNVACTVKCSKQHVSCNEIPPSDTGQLRVLAALQWDVRESNTARASLSSLLFQLEVCAGDN
jgi:hypothetical protein